MERIDFKAITEEVVAMICKMALEQRTGSHYRIIVTKIHYTAEMVRSMLLLGVWKKSLDLLYDKRNEPMSVEKALDILMKKGVSRESIHFRTGSFRVQLENAQYRIYKLFGTKVFACPWPAEERWIVSLAPEQFATFLMRFDEEVPAIVGNVATIMDVFRARELEEKKRSMIAEIEKRYVQSLVDQYLKPLDLSFIYRIEEGGKVVLDLKKELWAHLEIPLSELADTLKDTGKIVESLELRPPK